MSMRSSMNPKKKPRCCASSIGVLEALLYENSAVSGAEVH
jgi:hypothetical protein